MPDSTISVPTKPTVLCIGGLDPSGGAGVLADARACAAFGTHALTVVTAIVVQNTRGVKSIDPIAPEVIAAQIETLLEDIRPGAIKIGMMPGALAALAIAARLRPLHGTIPMVMDTVFAPSSGPAFNNAAAINHIAHRLLPLATVVTPNALEARQLGAPEITDLDSMKEAAIFIHKRTGAANVLVKGGHVADPEFATDLLFDGGSFKTFSAPRCGSYEVRGTGCLLASALAADLAHGKTVPEATQSAKNWLTEQYGNAQMVGGGRRVAAI